VSSIYANIHRASKYSAESQWTSALPGNEARRVALFSMSGHTVRVGREQLNKDASVSSELKKSNTLPVNFSVE
jgi:hypothetical protein